MSSPSASNVLLETIYFVMCGSNTIMPRHLPTPEQLRLRGGLPRPHGRRRARKGSRRLRVRGDAGQLRGSHGCRETSRAGYTEVLELREGLEGWKSAGLPLAVENEQKTFDSAPTPNGWLSRSRGEPRGMAGPKPPQQAYGQVALKSGKLHFDQGQLVAGEFTLDMRAITCQDLAGDPLHNVLIAHLVSHDFFDVELFPEARFVIITNRTCRRRHPRHAESRRTVAS